MEVKHVTAEVVEPEESLPGDLRALLRFARLLDEAVTIPGTRKKIGLDAAVGLIPGVGDALGAVFSLAIVMGALRHRVPFRVIVKMLFNIGIDLTVGLIPVVGDVFDLFFTENMGNVQLLIRTRDRTRPPRRWGSIAVVALITSASVAVMALGVALIGVWAIFWLIEQR